MAPVKKKSKKEAGARSQVSAPLSDIFIEHAKTKILGKSYELSLAYITPARIHALNKSFRSKDHPTTILSFPLSKKSGEILLCKNVIAREARELNTEVTSYTKYLVIHGMLHLKGMLHGATMERSERKWATYFKVAIPASLH